MKERGAEARPPFHSSPRKDSTGTSGSRLAQSPFHLCLLFRSEVGLFGLLLARPIGDGAYRLVGYAGPVQLLLVGVFPLLGLRFEPVAHEVVFVVDGVRVVEAIWAVLGVRLEDAAQLALLGGRGNIKKKNK